ncbi:hypothetical protein D3C71_1412990 [compost metagenome]
MDADEQISLAVFDFSHPRLQILSLPFGVSLRTLVRQIVVALPGHYDHCPRLLQIIAEIQRYGQINVFLNQSAPADGSPIRSSVARINGDHLACKRKTPVVRRLGGRHIVGNHAQQQCQKRGAPYPFFDAAPRDPDRDLRLLAAGHIKRPPYPT